MEHELMGDLPGHLFPGSAYVVWGVVWALWLMRRGGNAALNPWDARPDPDLGASPAAAVPWEWWLKIAIPLVEMAGELRWVTYPLTDGSATVYQHIAADLAVILAGVTDRLTARKILPPGTDKIALSFAFMVPAFLFAVHGHHFVVATVAHQLFAWTLFSAGLLVLLEHIRPAPLFRWLRIYAVILAGTWFIQTGWMLYVAGYDLNSESVAMRGYLFFTWHALVVAIGLLVVLARGRRA